MGKISHNTIISLKMGPPITTSSSHNGSSPANPSASGGLPSEIIVILALIAVAIGGIIFLYRKFRKKSETTNDTQQSEAETSTPELPMESVTDSVEEKVEIPETHDAESFAKKLQKEENFSQVLNLKAEFASKP